MPRFRLIDPPAATRSTAEENLQAAIIKACQLLGWRHYHTRDSRRSVPGFPDLVLCHPDTGTLLFRELKSDTGKLTPEQAEWLEMLRRCGMNAGVWRPRDWPSIERTLTHPRRS